MIATLRAILDSRYADFVYNGENAQYNADFVDYVYYWLGTYCVDAKTRRVVRYQSKNDEDNGRLW